MDINKIKEELIRDQAEYLEVSKRKRQLKSGIKSRLEQIKKLESVTYNPHNNLIYRDLDLCVDYIRKNVKVTSGELIQYLNVVLNGKELRWPVNKPLDSNFFMGRIGTKLKEDKRIRYSSSTSGKKTTIWEIK